MTASAATRPTATIQTIVLAALDPAPGKNPNRMTPERFASLKATIAEGDFYQPILVRPTPGAPGRFTVVDGMHRWKAMAENGFTTIPAVVADLTEHEATITRIGMNRLRGELDLGVVAQQVADLKLAGLSLEDIAFTGFSIDEVNDLVQSTLSTTTNDVLNSPTNLGDEPSDDDAGNPKPFVLELTFATKADLSRAKRGLRKAAGKGRGLDMAVGLLRLIDGA